MAKMKLKIWRLGVVQIPSPTLTPNLAPELPTDSAHNGNNENNEKALLPGYYLMLYLRGVVQSIIDSKVRYFGPFMTATEARFLQTSAVALGIVESAVSIYDACPTLDPQQHFLKESP